MNCPMKSAILALALAAGATAHADLLFSNGPLITHPTGGTGPIAGLPISVAEPFTIPSNPPLTASTLGINAAVSRDVAVADDFVVTGDGWDLDSVTLYAFQTSQTTPTVEFIHINLWYAAPYSADSPPPVPDPLPQPVFATDLVLPAGPGTFVCHREGHTSTSTVRPVFSYTVSLNDLPGGGVLPPGTYWLEWSFVGAMTPSQNVFTPLVTPRAQAFNLNARLYNSIDGSVSGPRVWFEGREGYAAGVSDGRPYALPFELQGTVVPEPAAWSLALVGAATLCRPRGGRPARR